MKYIRFISALLVLILTLAFPAAAASVSQLHSNSEIRSDGSCHVELTLLLELDESYQELAFPIPEAAVDVHLGGTPAQTRTAGNRQLVPLDLRSGSYTVTIRYTIPHAVQNGQNGCQLTLDLLSGFDLPIAAFSFSVTFPGQVTCQPSFYSGYYQETIHSHLQYSIADNTLLCTAISPIKDHETLRLTLELDPSLFSEMGKREPLLTIWDWAILITAALAAVYYCTTLFPKLTKMVRCYGMPDGVTAGELGTCLTGCGTDLTMLVISWAQLGYLTIEIDGPDHVTLRKRMEMGNERSDLETRCFRDLFKNRTVVDGTGSHYASICHKMVGKSAILRQLYDPKSGSPHLFRLMMLIPGILLGVQMGISMGGSGGGRILLGMLLGVISAALCYFIQSGGKCLPLRDKSPLLLCLACGLLWLIPGLICSKLYMTVFMVILQFLAGIAAAYGGKRSELGVRTLAQIRGLRHHLRKASANELQQRMYRNGEYFYELAPYALALGLDRKFARRFGKALLPESSYLDVGTDRPMTASQWAAELRFAADILNRSQKRLRRQRIR